MTGKITKDMKISDIVKQYPEAAPIMLSYGLHCVGCHISSFETIEQGCQGHGMPEEMFNDLLEELNEYVKQQADKEQ